MAVRSGALATSYLGGLRAATAAPRVHCAAAAATRRFIHSVATEQAARVTDPSPAAPATGPAPNNAPGDPHVFWREHWDLEKKKPYYHNLKTHELLWTMPDGFNTRFLFYYRRLSEEAGVGHTSADHVEAQKIVGDGKARSWKERIKDYGPAGLILYGIIHFGSLSIFFTAMFFGLDVTAVARKFGFDIEPSQGKSTVALYVAAIAVNKIFSPLHVLLTLALAPKVTPIMRRVGSKIYSSNK
jgi:hypothetical protein